MSIWPFSSAARTAALPIPALRSGVNPFALSSATVIAVMICCSVNAFPPTTIVCAAAPPQHMIASAAPVSHSLNNRFISLPPRPLKFSGTPQRIDAARYEPILRLPEQKIHGDREERRWNRAGEHHAMLLQVDAGEDELAQSTASDQERDR